MTMPGVGFFGMLVIGLLAGYVAGRTMNRDQGMLVNILVGIAGAFVGGALAEAFDISFHGFLGNLVVATGGAIVVLWVVGLARKR